MKTAEEWIELAAIEYSKHGQKNRLDFIRAIQQDAQQAALIKQLGEALAYTGARGMTDTISAGSIVLLQPNNVKAHLVGYASNGDAVLETSGGDFESFPPECIEPVTPIEPKKISDEARELARIMAQHFTAVDTGTCDECLQLAQSALTAARNKALEDAAKACEMPSVPGGDIARTALLCANAIRAMKVEGK